MLVVDDYADARESIREMLEELGHQVVEAANGQEALNYLIFNQEAEVNLIVLDLQMPVMNGWEFLKLLGSYVRLARIPVLVVSAFASGIQPGQYAAVVGCLQAPYEMPQLQQLVQAATGSPAPENAG